MPSINATPPEDHLTSGRLHHPMAPSHELLLLRSLLYAMIGIDSDLIHIEPKEDEDHCTFTIDPSLDPSAQELASRILPLCESVDAIQRFVERRSQPQEGLVSHALAGALRALLQDHLTFVAQLESRLLHGNLSLQDTWYFCQPMLHVMQVIASITRAATSDGLYGASLLNLLQQRTDATRGSPTAVEILERLQVAARAPYFSILRTWLLEGVIADPHGEFFIEEHKELLKEELSSDYGATYWRQRYKLRREQPDFLREAADKILTTGKYLNAIRECGEAVLVPVQLVELDSRAAAWSYQEQVDKAYHFASQKLVSLLFDKFDLRGRLLSIKHYFLLDQGDFLVHFVDIAKDELKKWPANVSLEKLQPLLELALRTSVCSADPYNRDLSCSLASQPMAAHAKAVAGIVEESRSEGARGAGAGTTQSGGASSSSSGGGGGGGSGSVSGSASSSGNPSARGAISGWETFQFDYKVAWPVSVVVSKLAVTMYQLLFRSLFHCKYVERELSSACHAHKAAQRTGLREARVSASLCHRMLHFIKQLQDYQTLEIMEPRWHAMLASMQHCSSIDEALQQHNAFLTGCLAECGLLDLDLLKRIEKLKQVCLQYTAATKWVMGRLETLQLSTPPRLRSHHAPPGGTHRGDASREEAGKGSSERARQRQLAKEEVLEQAQRLADEFNFSATLEKVDTAFQKELKDALNILRASSARNACFARLSDRLQQALR